MVGGWGGPIFFLEKNLAFQNIKHHTQFQPSISKRLETIPRLNMGTDDTRHPPLKNFQFRRGQKESKEGRERLKKKGAKKRDRGERLKKIRARKRGVERGGRLRRGRLTFSRHRLRSKEAEFSPVGNEFAEEREIICERGQGSLSERGSLAQNAIFTDHSLHSGYWVNGGEEEGEDEEEGEEQRGRSESHREQ